MVAGKFDVSRQTAPATDSGRFGTRFDSLTPGDVIHRRGSETRYRVAGFNEHPAGLHQGALYVYLASETDKPGDYTMRRTFDQLVKNWRKLKEAD